MFKLCAFKAFSPQILHIESGVFVKRYFKHWVAPTLKEIQRRRQRLGPEKPVHRSTKINWNYDAEIFAYGKRLSEEFKPDTLRAAFTFPSYIVQEEMKRKELGMTAAPLNLTDNTKLIAKGEAITKEYIPAYLRHTHPFFPEEGIISVYNFLVSERVLSHVCSMIGTPDLILCVEFPPSQQTLAKTLLAVIGVVEADANLQRAETFVRDFVLPQLIGQDVNYLWPIVDPMRVLMDILKREGRELPECRLIRQSGSTTIQAVYNVGIYSAKKMIGAGPGETVNIAQEMAARDALKRLFQTSISKSPLPLGTRGHGLKINKSFMNLSLSEWTTQLATQNASRLLQ